MAFLRQQLGEQLSERHRALLDAYNDNKKSWHEVIDDGYLYDYLVYHLEAADRIDDIHELFQNREWAAKRGNPVALLSDFERAQQLVVSNLHLRLRYAIFRAAVDETYRDIPVTAALILLIRGLIPFGTLINVLRKMQGNSLEKLTIYLKMIEIPTLTNAQRDACIDAIVITTQSWNGWTYGVSSSMREKTEHAAVLEMIERVIRTVRPYHDQFRVLRRVLWKQIFSLDDETRSRLFEELFNPPLDEQERTSFVKDVMEERRGF